MHSITLLLVNSLINYYIDNDFYFLNLEDKQTKKINSIEQHGKY